MARRPSSQPDPRLPIVAALEEAGFVRDGTTSTEEVRVSTARSPVLGRTGGELRTFGGRERWSLPGTRLRCTIGPRTTNVYTVGRDGDVRFVGQFDTKGIDLEKLRAGLRVAARAAVRVPLEQSVYWSRSLDDGNCPYDDSRCCYCHRPTTPESPRLRTARTNDGAWFVVGPTVDLSAAEWRDFQTQIDGSRAATVLPIGPECLRQHPEFRVGLVVAPTEGT